MQQSFYPLSNPTLADLLDRHKLEVSRSINCVLIGAIESFDASTNTASVTISAKREYMDGEVLDFPLLTDCPVFTPQGGGSWLSFPISSGDPCIVLFNDRDIDQWFLSGQAKVPGSTRAHSLSDGLVLVGIQPLTGALSIDDSQVELHGGTNKVKVSSTVEVDVTAAKVVTTGSTGGIAEKMTTGKYSVKNSAVDLKTLIDYLIDKTSIFAAGTIAGAPLNTSAVYIADLTYVKTQLNLLMEAGS